MLKKVTLTWFFKTDENLSNNCNQFQLLIPLNTPSLYIILFTIFYFLSEILSFQVIVER